MRIIMCPENASLWSVMRCWMGHPSPYTVMDTKHTAPEVETLLSIEGDLGQTPAQAYEWSVFGNRITRRGIETPAKAEHAAMTYQSAFTAAGELAAQRTNVKEAPDERPFA